MDYQSTYVSLADQLRNQIKTEAAAPRRGLGSRSKDVTPLEVPESRGPQVDYMALVDSMFASSREEAQTGPDVASGDFEDVYMDGPLPEEDMPKGEVAQYVYEGLVDRGLPPHVAKGMVMNFKDESGLKADIVEYEPNVHGTRGKGLYQLTGDRRDAYEAKFGDDYSIDNQLDWLMYELGNTEKRAYNKMIETSTAGEAGAAIVTHFLRPAKEHRDSRVAKYLNLGG